MIFGAAMPGLTAGIVIPVIGALIYSIWWGLPSMMTAKRAEEGDPSALAILAKIRWTGLLTWLIFIPRHRDKEAPACRRVVPSFAQAACGRSTMWNYMNR